MDASAFSHFLGPFGALILALVGGVVAARWLVKRLETADLDRKAERAEMATLVRDNTAAMLSCRASGDAQVKAQEAVASEVRRQGDEVRRLADAFRERGITDPGLRVVTTEKAQ